MHGTRTVLAAALTLSTVATATACGGSDAPPPATTSTDAPPAVRSGPGIDEFGHEKVSAKDLKPVPQDASPRQIAEGWLHNCNIMMATGDRAFYAKYRDLIVGSSSDSVGIDQTINGEIDSWAKSRDVVYDDGSVLDPPIVTLVTLGTAKTGVDSAGDPAIELTGFIFHLYDGLNYDDDLDNDGVPTVFAYKTGIDLDERVVGTWVVVQDRSVR